MSPKAPSARELFCGLFAIAFLNLLFGTAHGAEPPGTLKWTYPTGGYIHSSPAIGADGTIYVGSEDRKVYAIRPGGTLKWTYPTGGYIHSSPAIGADGTIYVGSDDRNLYAISPGGTLRWAYLTGDYIYSSPAIGADGTIYVGSDDHNLYAITPGGTLKWTYPTGGYIHSSPAIGADGTIYVGSGDHKVYAVNSDGTPKWTFPTRSWIYSSPAIGADGTVYVGSGDRSLYAINPDGTLKWTYATKFWIYSSPAVGADGTVYVASNDHNLYAINSDGTLKWSYVIGHSIEYSSPAIGADDTIYVGSDDRNLYALNPDGTLKWTYLTENYIYSSPAIGTDGTIYVGSWDSNLYAVHSSSPGIENSPWPMFRHDPKHRGRISPMLNVSASGTGTGTVISSPAGIDCGSSCSAGYRKGTLVDLTPTPSRGSVFTGWTGDCRGTGTCAVMMGADRSVGAGFDTGSCTYTASSTGRNLTHRGGKIRVRVTARDYAYCAAPEITGSTDWITYTAAAVARNMWTVKISIPSLDSSIDRAQELTIGGKAFTVSQKGKPCTFMLRPIWSDFLSSGAASGAFTVRAEPDDCSWTVLPDMKSAAWITIASGGSGAGSGPVDYRVAGNASGRARSGRITVTLGEKNKSYMVRQGK